MPSKNYSFRVVVAGKAGKRPRETGDLGEAVPPQTPPLRKVSYNTRRNSAAYFGSAAAICL